MYDKLGDNDYNILKEQQALQQRLADQNLQKRLSDLPLTVQSNAQMAALQNMGDIARQRQTFNQQQNYLANRYGLESAAQQADLSSQLGLAKAKAQVDEENTKLSVYYTLYRNKKITAAQFKKLTGIDVKDVASGGGGGGKSYSNNVEDFFNNPDYKDAPMLENFAPSTPYTRGFVPTTSYGYSKNTATKMSQAGRQGFIPQSYEG